MKADNSVRTLLKGLWLTTPQMQSGPLTTGVLIGMNESAWLNGGVAISIT